MQEAPPGVTELTALEAQVAGALKVRDASRLEIIGQGEMTMAVGWPARAPRYACKRTPPFSPAEFKRYQSLVTEYVEQLRALGQKVADTTVVGIERESDVVGYVVQPMLDRDTLGHNVLSAAEPDPDHPMLAAVADAIGRATPTCSLDCQVTNFGWDGQELTLIDVGTPFMWTASGDLRLEIKPFSRMLPGPVQGLAVKELAKTVNRWREQRTIATDVVANLIREGLTEWVDPMLVALNRGLELDEPITLADGQAHYEEDLKIFPTLVKLQGVARWWREKVRRQPYEWFIWSTFDT